MDTRNRIPKCACTADIGEHRVLVGAKQIRKAIAAGTAKKVFLARNADPAITEPLKQLCIEHGVPCVDVRSMADLGRACRIDVGASAAALID